MPTPQNSQTHSNNSSATANELFEFFDYFVGLALKGLTKHRLNGDFTFHTIGVDKFGPLNIFSTKNDNSALLKVWVTLFVYVC